MARLIYLGFAGVLGYIAYLYNKGLPIEMPLKAAAGVLGFFALYAYRSASSMALAAAGKIPRYNTSTKRVG